MDKYFVFTDCDLDGACSYLSIKWLLGPNPLPYKATTVKNFATDFSIWLSKNDINSFKKIFILDIDVSKNINLVDHPNVIVIDHHQTHKPDYKKAVKIVKPHTSNVDLIKQTLLKNINLTPEQQHLITLVDDYDSYALKHQESLLLNFLYWQYQGDRIRQFVIDFESGFKPFNIQQRNIILLQLKKLQEHIQTNPIYYYKNEKYVVASMFGDFSINELADHVLKKTQCDIACIVNTRLKRIYFRRKKTSNVSLFSAVEEITGEKGEGHDNACGGTITEKFLEYTKLLSVYEKDKYKSI